MSSEAWAEVWTCNSEFPFPRGSSMTEEQAMVFLKLVEGARIIKPPLSYFPDQFLSGYGVVFGDVMYLDYFQAAAFVAGYMAGHVVGSGKSFFKQFSEKGGIIERDVL